MPDPLPALEQAEVLQKKVHKLGEIEIENQKLKDTINTYKKDFAEMKNNESKVQKLEKQLNEAKESNQENANKVHFWWTLVLSKLKKVRKSQLFKNPCSFSEFDF